jgi:hypothetical protein
MEPRLVKLKGDFNNIITVRNNVKNVFDILEVRIDKLREIYMEFIETNKNAMFVFGLDSFNFQSKLIDIEYHDMKRLFLAINNRMYCEYFKLHKIIVDYISKNINDRKGIDIVKVNSYPVYKDLEPFKEYKFELILDIHENILNLLSGLISILNNKENELSIHKTKQNIGLNIDNFITTFNYNLSVLREKIAMFISYIEFFHKMHSKYLKRFSNKIQLMYTHINNDIKFDDSIEISKNKKKELIDDFLNNDIDKELLKDLKTSIGSETNSEDGSTLSKITTPVTLHNNSNASPFIKSISRDSMKMTNEKIVNTYYKKFTHNGKEGKGDLKQIFKNNVNKVSNFLKILKPKKDESDKMNSNYDLDNIFTGIDASCDSIINGDINEINFYKEKVLINKNQFSKSNSFDLIDIDSQENSFVIHNEHSVNDNIIIQQDESKEEEAKIEQEESTIVEELIIEEESKIEEEEPIDKEPIEEESIEEESKIEKEESIEEPKDDLKEELNGSSQITKKKRKYNKKKK